MPREETPVIVLNLHCTHGHDFEGWFASSSAFDDQLAAGLVECPMCGSASIERRPSAPYVQARSNRPPQPATAPEAQAVARVVARLREAAS